MGTCDRQQVQNALWGKSEDMGERMNLSQIRAGRQRAPCQVVSFSSRAHY